MSLLIFGFMCAQILTNALHNLLPLWIFSEINDNLGHESTFYGVMERPIPATKTMDVRQITNCKTVESLMEPYLWQAILMSKGFDDDDDVSKSASHGLIILR